MSVCRALLCLGALLLGAPPVTAKSALAQGDVGPFAVSDINPDKPKDPRDPPEDPEPEPGPAQPEGGSQLCAAANCLATTGGSYLCPIGQVACMPTDTGAYRCPTGDDHACHTLFAGGSPVCSPNRCASLDTAPIIEAPPLSDPGAAPNGAVDADGNCVGTIEIFGGRAMRCRPAGIATTFSNCCRNKGEIVKDGMGSSFNSLATKITVAKGVFTGMSAAFTAFKAGATAGQAANAGANALILGLDPTSIAISLAINFMVEFLFSGCDGEDMEVGMLKGSGMCHEVGSYCTASFLGLCLQKAYGHCCFNTKLGRLIQEQGRPQLKSFNAIGWGTATQPLCRGFTPEEFQALDFSKMDLSDYYADIATRAQSDIQIDMKERVDAYLDAVRQ